MKTKLVVVCKQCKLKQFSTVKATCRRCFKTFEQTNSGARFNGIERLQSAIDAFYEAYERPLLDRERYRDQQAQRNQRVA